MKVWSTISGLVTVSVPKDAVKSAVAGVNNSAPDQKTNVFTATLRLDISKDNINETDTATNGLECWFECYDCHGDA